MAAVICLDFDDTVVLENTTQAVFEHFAGGAAAPLEDAYHRGELSVEQYNLAALDLVPTDVTAEEIRAFVAELATPRDGILELTDWAHWHGWFVAVVSNGFDFSIDPVLDRLGLDRVARHCGRARPGYRWRGQYTSPRGIEIQEGFKLAYAAAFRNAGDFVVYCGDGASDIEAARLAPVVFARDTLWAALQHEHPRIAHFETFHDVIKVLERDAEGWLAEFARA